MGLEHGLCIWQVLVAEERNGWARLSEHDDEWGVQLASAASGSGALASRQAWMLIDASSFGLGRLLERQPLPLA